MSAERQRDVQVDVSFDENAARVTGPEAREVADLFDENGEFRLWEDDAGWNGYLLEDGSFFAVNTHHDADDRASKQPVQEHTVQEADERLIYHPRRSKSRLANLADTKKDELDAGLYTLRRKGYVRMQSGAPGRQESI